MVKGENMEELIYLQTLKEIADQETKELLDDILLEMMEGY